ncbi:AMP-binding protein [Streptomyces sp. NPDC004065]|uniref:AMP-binding protein n=1 Tax=Streptomyces sp. NPDC004065 TaxID=3364689 RepID=UPI00384A92FB
MTFPLTMEHLLWRMRNVHRGSEVVAVVPGGTEVQRASFPETAARARALAVGLRAVYGLDTGSVVAVLAFNTRQHLEILLGVPTVGAVVESINIRTGTDVILDQLSASRPGVVLVDQEALDHAIVGPTARAVLEACRAAGRPTLVMDSHTGTGLRDIIAAGEREPSSVAQVSENDAAYLYHTSGTTGRPKTYTVTHRDAVLHALSQATTVAADLRPEDRVLPLAPFFHVNGWGLPLTCAMTGSDLVLMGADASAASVVDVLEAQSVTVAAAVPTVWYDVCEIARQRRAEQPAGGGAPRTALREVLTGGSVVPASVAAAIENHLGARVATAWGMTETMACSTYEREDPSSDAGLPIPLVETRVVDVLEDQGGDIRGRLEVRGAFVVGARNTDHGDQGWLDTGDIASIGEDGRLRLHDRQKDLIKSGGEWIVSAELEQRLCGHPGVSSAAVVARPHPRWMERPVAYVVLRPGLTAEEVSPEDLREHLAAELPRWWLPDDITITDDLPRTAVGKVDKAFLRRAQGDRETAGAARAPGGSDPSDDGHESETAA